MSGPAKSTGGKSGGDSMNARNAATFSALPANGQAEVLAHLAHELTVAARDGYEAGTADLADPARVRTLNEIQHRVTGHLAALLHGNAARYPDEVLVRVVLDHPGDPGLERRLGAAFARALGLVAVRA